MGFLLPIVIEKLSSSIRGVLVVLLATVLIEIFQYAFGVDATDIDDVIMI